MNILYLANHLNAGGITSYIYSLSCGLKKKGHNIFIASSSGDAMDKFLKLGVSLIKIPIRTKKEIGPGVFFSYLKLKSELKKNKIDLIHSNSRTTQVLGCLLGRSCHVAHVSTCHGYFKTRLLRRLFPCWGKKVIAISQEVKDHLHDDFKVEESRIRLVNSGIDINRFSALKRNQAASPVIGIIARLSDVKGHIYLIKAMKAVLEKHPDAKLLVVGEGKMYNTLLEQVKDLGIGRSVEFIMRTDDTRNELALMDIFVMPSLKEGLGLALMEAMACAKPVVASRVGGIKTLVQDRENGLLVEPANPGQLAEAIIGLLNDKGLAEKLGTAAAKSIAGNFSLEKMVDQTERVYLECVS